MPLLPTSTPARCYGAREMHRFGDRRMPLPGAIGGISAAACTAAAFAGGLFTATIAASTATHANGHATGCRT